ncbi:MAG: M10 family metallopeptidase C-terminal domain-containing protein, partial [Rhodobacteraceae bacterium]|nr:M10 family metallopeptidase C-terminal domain-containing protein [Paracoccaceae bacterium]
KRQGSGGNGSGNGHGKGRGHDHGNGHGNGHGHGHGNGRSIKDLPWAAVSHSVGTASDDSMTGADQRDWMRGRAGNDELAGGAGDDRLDGGRGNDRIVAGAGNDFARGRDGNDRFVATEGDGDDTYLGEDGEDTLDMSAILASIRADLGSGGGRGLVESAATGRDVIRGVENIVTGAGDDVITASAAANVMDGGAGNDTFRFLSARDADGDTILNFAPGDRIDLSAIDARRGTSGNEAFTLVTGTEAGVGQIVVTHETREDGVYTVVTGRTGDGEDDDFSLSIRGLHNLTANDFNL